MENAWEGADQAPAGSELYCGRDVPSQIAIASVCHDCREGTMEAQQRNVNAEGTLSVYECQWIHGYQDLLIHTCSVRNDVRITRASAVQKARASLD
jgi:hypothetical protein